MVIKEALKYEIFYIILWHIFSIIFAVVINVYIYLKAKKNELLSQYMKVQLCILIWMISKILKTVSPNVEMRWFFIVMQYFGACLLSSSFLVFAYTYAKRRTLKLRNKIYIHIPALISFLIISSNEYHHLFYATYDFRGDTFGPLFYYHIFYSYTYIFAGIYFCAIDYKKRMIEIPVIQTRLFAVAFLLPLVINFMYVFNLIHPLFDITPIVFNLSIVIFGYTAFKQQFLDIQPIIQSKVLEELNEGVLFLRTSGEITHVTEGIKNFGFSKSEVRENDFFKLLNQTYHFEDGALCWLDMIKSDQYLTPKIGRLKDKEEIKVIEIHVYPVKTNKGRKKWIMIISEITDMISLCDAINSKNQDLEINHRDLIRKLEDVKTQILLNERSRIAQDLHDILGHSITLVISLLEASRIAITQDVELGKTKISQAIAVSRKGLQELKSSVWEVSDKNITTLELKNSVEAILKTHQESKIHVEFVWKGSHGMIHKKQSSMIKKVILESISNAIRHGHAEHLHIFLYKEKERCRLFMIDDGNGCQSIKYGNGLNGMKMRVKEWNGTFSCGSSEAKGFNIHIEFPIVVQ